MGHYEIHQGEVAKLLWGKTPGGGTVPIYPALNRRAKQVQRAAKMLVGKDTGLLMSRITLSSRAAPPFWLFKVEGNTRYAYMHHEGTRPHLIEGNLKFRGTGGRVVHARVVRHPGTRGNPFLRTALRRF
jgi:hypothetical protein